MAPDDGGRTIRVHHKTREESDPSDYDAEALGVDGEGYLRVRPLGGPKAAAGEISLSGEEVSITPMGLATKAKDSRVASGGAPAASSSGPRDEL